MFFLLTNLVDLNDKKDKILDQLLCAHRDGKHYVWYERKDHKILNDRFKSNTILTPILFQLWSVINEGISIKNALNFYIILDFSDTDTDLFKLYKKEDECYLLMNYQYLLSLEEFDQKICLMSENLTDVHIYLIFADIFKQYTSELTHLSLASEKYSGGGDQTARCFEEKKKEKITLCIADSDKKYPKSDIRKTGRDVLSVKILEGEIAKAHVIECHEAENLFPPNIWKKWHNQSQSKDDIRDYGLLFDQSFNQADRKDFVRYIDYKKGLTLLDIDNHENRDFKNYWKIFPSLEEEKKKSTTRMVCIGLGDHALKGLMEEINSNQVFRNTVTELLCHPDNWYVLWKKYAHTVCSWAIASNKSRVS